jgi:hypothetical protein
MGKKKQIKLIKKAISEFRQEQYIKEPEISSNDYIFTEIDKESMVKVKDMISRLLNYISDLDVSRSGEYITIYSKSSNNSKFSKIYLHIQIVKNVGITININDNVMRIKYESLFDELENDIKSSIDKSNKERFDTFYNDLVKSTGLKREVSLDELFSL